MLQSMVNDFKAKHTDSKCSLEIYRQTMKEMRIEDCETLKEKIENGVENANVEYKIHKEKAEKL